MDKPIPTSVHGVIDYLSVPTFLALPRALGWNKKVTNLLTGIGLGTLAASMMTRYELGLFKIIPMQGHLALDMMNGVTMAAAPFLLLKKYERSGTLIGVLMGLGAFEIMAALLTKTQPSPSSQMINTPIPSRLRELVTSG